jgi:hypothetical protein
MIDALVGLWHWFLDRTAPAELSPEELARLRREEDERVRTEYLLNHRRSEVDP